MKLTEWRRRRIIQEEYQRLLEEGFRTEVRRQIQERLTIDDSCGAVSSMQPAHVIGLSLVPVFIVILEALVLLR